MDVTLSADLQEFVKQQVDSGRYESVSDVITDAIAFWRESEAQREQDLEELRREIAIAIRQSERGESVPWDLDRVKQRIIQRMAERRNG